jgi:hypothetical protein
MSGDLIFQVCVNQAKAMDLWVCHPLHEADGDAAEVINADSFSEVALPMQHWQSEFVGAQIPRIGLPSCVSKCFISSEGKRPML